MNEHNTGMEPDVRLFFRKIMQTISVGLLWLMIMATLGLFMQWAYVFEAVRWQNIVFYGLFLVTFILFIRYLFRLWARKG